MSDFDWWRGAVMYQIYPRSFKDTNGDGVGDLKGITSSLDYVASLGVDGVWISPFFKSPMKDFGYDIESYRDIDPLFGTMDDFDHLIVKAHHLGLKVIMDMVLSHTSERHEWFQESRKSKDNPKANWYVWADARPDGSPPNNWRSVFGGEAWEFDTRRGQYYLHNFLKEQPDLNFHEPDVHKHILEACEFWLERGVDGFRLDAINYIYHDKELRDNPPADFEKHGLATQFQKIDPYSMQQHLYDKSQPEAVGFLKKLRLLADKYDGTMMLAEVGDTSTTLPGEYTDGPEMLHTAYSFGLLGYEKLNFSKLKSVINDFSSQSDASWPSWAFSNHDVIRVASRWGSYVDRKYKDEITKTLIALLCALRGTVFMYQGEELGLTEAQIPYEQLQDPWGIYLWPEWQGRDGCRTPMVWKHDAQNAGFTDDNATPWLPISNAHKKLAVDVQEKDAGSFLHFTREMIAFRKRHTALKKGDMKFLDSLDNELIAFTRQDDEACFLCLFNLSEKQIDYSLQDLKAKKDGAYLHGDDEKCEVYADKVNIKPCRFVIIELG